MVSCQSTLRGVDQYYCQHCQKIIDFWLAILLKILFSDKGARLFNLAKVGNAGCTRFDLILIDFCFRDCFYFTVLCPFGYFCSGKNYIFSPPPLILLYNLLTLYTSVPLRWFCNGFLFTMVNGSEICYYALVTTHFYNKIKSIISRPTVVLIRIIIKFILDFLLAFPKFD